MKLNKLSQLALVSAAGLVAAAVLAGCNLVTVDYVFVAASQSQASGSAGQIYAYAVDAESGAIRSALPAVSSGGSGPVSLATTSDYYNLYVANQGNNTVVHFSISGNGSLTEKDSVTLPAAPVALAVNSANTYLYVVSGTASATLTEYPLSNGAIGSAAATESLTLSSYSSDILVPSGVNVLANGNAVFVTADDRSAYNPGGTTTSNANPGWLFGYSVASGGALTPVPGNPYQAGVKPSALASDPTNRFIYVTDYASNGLIGYTVLSSGALTFMIDGPFKTGNEPGSIVVDPRGLYIYLTDSLDDSVTAYSITLSSGIPSLVVSSGGSPSYTTETDPVAIAIEPSLGRFVYTANHLDNSISGFRLDPDTGVLSATQDSPYPIGGIGPAALIAVPHGNHATQAVAP